MKIGSLISKKGSTAEVVTILLVSISIFASGSYFIILEDTRIDSQSKVDSSDFMENPNNIEVETTYVENGSMYASIRNKGDSAGNISIVQAGRELNRTVIESKKTRAVQLNCLRTAPDLEIYVGGKKDTAFIPVEPKYCIKIQDSHIEKIGNKGYKVWEATAFRNNFEKTPYANKNISINIDQNTTIKKTNSSGEFTFKARWGLPYLLPERIWEYKESYTSSGEYQEYTHNSQGRFQPPDRAKLTYEDGREIVYQTQEGLELKEGNNLELYYQVRPKSVTSNSITLQNNISLTALSGMADDWKNNKGKMLYQMPIEQDWHEAKILMLNCSTSTPDVTCDTGEQTITLSSETANTKFDRSSLPEEGGEKYIPRKYSVSTSGQPFIGGIFRKYDYRYRPEDKSDTWIQYDRFHDVRYIPEGETYSSYDNITLNKINQSLYADTIDGSINASGMHNSELVTTLNGDAWGSYPDRKKKHYYSVNDNLFASKSDSTSKTHQSVLYEWKDVSVGQTYNFSYEITLKRDPNRDRKFMLPKRLGTLAMFPENGGKAISGGPYYGSYSEGFMAYPEFRKAARTSFEMPIRKQGSDQATVYKNVYSTGGDEWKAVTYILNTAQERVEEIYLLNSRGEWFDPEEEYGIKFPSPGDTSIGTLNLRNNEGKVTQINLNFRIGDWSGVYSRPDYYTWPYEFEIDINEKDTTYTEDIGGTIECGWGACTHRKHGWGEEAGPIDDLLKGKSAKTSVYGEHENIESIDIKLKNPAGSEAVDLGTVNFKFWIWYLDPLTANIGNKIRPNNILIQTTENEPGISKGKWERNYE